MKKLIIASLVLVSVFSLAGCKSETENTYEIALIMESTGSIDDKSFNQGAWEGIEEFANSNELTSTYYQANEDSTAGFVSAVDLAVAGGAKVVVLAGFQFQETVYEVQTKYPEVNFVLLDGYPHSGDWAPSVESNTISIFYSEEESGFLAGYAAVKEGYTHLGFMGGKAFPAVTKFGYGFIEGANYAASEMSVQVTVDFTYLGDFIPSTAFQNKGSDWYVGGTEVIFVAAGGAGNSIMKAAEQNNGKVIGVDVDQSGESTVVITSALKGLASSVEQALEDIYGTGSFSGQILTLGATENGVGLPSDLSRMNNFTQSDYETVFNLLANDQYTFIYDRTASELPSITDAYSSLSNVTVNEK